jgi:hypothetical protein
MPKFAYVFLAALSFAPVAMIATVAHAGSGSANLRELQINARYTRNVERAVRHYYSRVDAYGYGYSAEPAFQVQMIGVDLGPNVCDRNGTTGFEVVSGSSAGTCVVGR